MQAKAETKAPTRATAGDSGARWNWQHEERDIRHMCETWARKKLNGQHSPKHAINMLDDLMAKEFRPVEHLIPDLVPAEGVTLLVAKSKVGKSWMLYDICISAALGRELLGGRKPKQGRSLYLALEDSAEAPAIPCGEAPGPRTWARARLLPRRRGTGSLTRVGSVSSATGCSLPARRPYRGLCLYRRVADGPAARAASGNRCSSGTTWQCRGYARSLPSFGIAILVAHHQRKSSADDLQVIPSQARRGSRPRPIARSYLSGKSTAASFSTCGAAISKPNSSPPLSIRKPAGGTSAVTPARCDVQETSRAIGEALGTGPPEGMSPQEYRCRKPGSRQASVRSALLRMAHGGVNPERSRGRYVRVAVPGFEAADRRTSRRP